MLKEIYTRERKRKEKRQREEKKKKIRSAEKGESELRGEKCIPQCIDHYSS